MLAFAVLVPTRGILVVHEQAQTPHQCEDVNSLLLAQSTGRLLPAATPAATGRHITARLMSVRLTSTVAHVVAEFFLSMVLLGTVRVALAWRAASQLVQQSQPTNLSAYHSETLQSCSHHLHVAPPEIRVSSALSSPVLVGALPPVLLLPIGFDRHTPDQIKAALCHELAHLRRHDYVVNLICRLASLPVIWHPVTHMVQRQIRRTCEMTCDALAAQHMCSELGYAKCLLALAQSMLQGRTPATHSPALGLFESNILEERVMHLIGKRNVMSLHAKLARIVGGATGMGAAIVVAAVFHLTPVMAQQSDVTAPQQVQSKPAPSPTPSAQPQSAPLAIARGDHAKVSVGKGSYIHRRKGEDGKTVVMANRDRRDPTPEEQRRAEKQLDEALKEPIFNNNFCDPDFKLQIEKASNAAQFTQSPEFKKQMAELQKHFQSEDFKKQIAEMQQLKSDEFKRQIELQKLQSAELKKQMAEVQKQFNSGEFRQQMDALQKQLQSGEFKQQMEKATQAIRDAQEQFKQQHAQ